MRYDKEVIFIHETKGTYNEDTGNYEEPTKTQITLYANVSPTSVENMDFLYGRLVQNSLTVRIQGEYSSATTSLEVKGEKYKIDRIKHHRFETVFFVSGG